MTPPRRTQPAPGPFEYPEGIPARAAMRGDRWTVRKDRETGEWYAEPNGVGVFAIWPTVPGLPNLERYRKKRFTSNSWEKAMNFADLKERER